MGMSLLHWVSLVRKAILLSAELSPRGYKQAYYLVSLTSLLFSLPSVLSNLEKISTPFRTAGVRRKLPFQPECCRTRLFSRVSGGWEYTRTSPPCPWNIFFFMQFFI